MSLILYQGPQPAIKLGVRYEAGILNIDDGFLLFGSYLGGPLGDTHLRRLLLDHRDYRTDEDYSALDQHHRRLVVLCCPHLFLELEV
jgi:hypothetical protein